VAAQIGGHLEPVHGFIGDAGEDVLAPQTGGVTAVGFGIGQVAVDQLPVAVLIEIVALGQVLASPAVEVDREATRFEILIIWERYS
jgi:hypothetical protein